MAATAKVTAPARMRPRASAAQMVAFAAVASSTAHARAESRASAPRTTSSALARRRDALVVAVLEHAAVPARTAVVRVWIVTNPFEHNE